MSKICVVTGSLRKGGNSDTLAQAFIQGAESAGNQVVLMEAGRAGINGCMGCMGCFAPGRDGACVQNDVMSQFYPDLRDADAIVFCSPVYFYNYTSQIKAFMDRLFCMAAKPFAIKNAALLLTFEDKDSTVPDGLIKSFEDCAAYCHWNVLGVVKANPCFEKGAIAGHPALEEARALGASIK